MDKEPILVGHQTQNDLKLTTIELKGKSDAGVWSLKRGGLECLSWKA